MLGAWYQALLKHVHARCRYLFNDAEVKSFDSAQLASECFGGEMTVQSNRTIKVRLACRFTLTDVTFMFQTKTYDSVTDKFMDFSFEKVKLTLFLL